MKNRTLHWLTILSLLAVSRVGAKEFFVAPEGRDEQPGTQDQPFATLEKARDAIRELKEKKGIPLGGVDVWIAGGRYHHAQALKLTSRDSGTKEAPITYRARVGDEVRIVGGREVVGFQPVTDPSVLARLVSEARGKVVQSNLKTAGLDDFGQVTARGNRLELFFQDQPMVLARWPNEGFVRVVDVVGAKPRMVHGISGNQEGKLSYEGDRPDRWQAEKDIWLHGYWFWDWSDSYEKVETVDRKQKVFSTVPPYHHYGYRKGQRYYALNLLAELDRPGEWYLDRETSILYFWPPSPVGEGSTVVSVARSLIALENTSWITLQGLTLEACRDTAVTISGGTHNRVAGCVIRNTGGWGASISGGTDNTVVGCDVYRIGEGGVSMSGGDRKTLAPARHGVENNHFHHFGRLYRTYRPAVSVGGVGNRVLHNLMHDGPHNAIQLGGNDHRIEFNEIHHVCFETGDVGAFYMGRDWTARGTVIRHNFFHHIQGPGLHGAMAVYLDDSASGIEIKGNIFYRAGRAAFIGGGRDNLVENNIFLECPASVHVDARGVGWMKYHVEEDGTLPKRLQAMPYRTPPWSERYPRLVNILEDEPGKPKGNVVRRNVSLGGKWLSVEKKALPLIEFEDNLVDVDPKFVDAGRLNFQLKPDSPAFRLGFQRIPTEKIGLRDDEYRPSRPGAKSRHPPRPVPPGPHAKNVAADGASGKPAAKTVPVGVASVEITPETPVRMYGYGSRKTESEGVAGRLFAKALAIGGDERDGPAVLLSVDCGAVPAKIVSEVFERLKARTKIKAERFVLCNTHNHSGPNVKEIDALPEEHRGHIARYSRELTDRLEKVVLEAIAARRPGRLARAEGEVGFAANRRILKDGKWAGFGAVPDAPVDHCLPVLRIADAEGKLVAVVVNYACHCTTLRANFKKIHGDWAGCAQASIEADHPGALAMISVGCGADSDPCPHGTVELAERHGREVANEVKRLLEGSLVEIDPTLTARRAVLEIPFTDPPPLSELEEHAKTSWSMQEMLERVKREEELPPREYTITTWTFGEDLAMIFLTGEVVVDYALRLKRELDANRLWITAYSHEIPCYLTSKRLIGEGGYEVSNSLSARVSFGQPEKVKPAMEDRIVEQVKNLLPVGFLK